MLMAVTRNLVITSWKMALIWIALFLAEAECSPVDIEGEEGMLLDTFELAEDATEEGSGDTTTTISSTMSTTSASTSPTSSTSTASTVNSTTTVSSTTAVEVPPDHPIPGWGLAIICLAVAIIVFAAGWLFFVR